MYIFFKVHIRTGRGPSIEYFAALLEYPINIFNYCDCKGKTRMLAIMQW